MSLTREHTQEDLSVAYISAVAAKAGFDCVPFGKHDYGVDLQIIPIEVGEDNRRYPDGIPLLIQAKASQNFHIDENNILYDLKTRNYNILVKERKGYPYILVLYCMPANENNWLKVEDDSTILKHNGYWKSLLGEPESGNTQSVRIAIPREQKFTESALKSIMVKIQEEEDL
ncbi:MAG: hypothetical protein A4E49_03176 [Methanosaeta sp. PtaU1.Bin112]|nr:MAG: hypothetical protein A4E49_03176 [Methanosaeta sp. PtaU1.Bin112]